MQIEKLVYAAIDLRIEVLKARKVGIINYQRCGDYFQIFAEDENIDVVSLLNGRDYKISIKDYDEGDFNYEYKFEIDGLEFITLVESLLFKGDENKIESEDK